MLKHRVALDAGRVIYATSSAHDPNDRYLDATMDCRAANYGSQSWQTAW
jgi:hypothetical protein